jgi:hypothetical protein
VLDAGAGASNTLSITFELVRIESVALAIEDYALIGDCETAALVGRRFHRLVVLAGFFVAGLFRGASRDQRERQMATGTGGTMPAGDTSISRPNPHS